MEQNDIIIYNTDDGKSSVVLVGADGMVWLNQLQMAELFVTSKQSISYHITNILKEKELPKIAVVKNILTTASCSLKSTRLSSLFDEKLINILSINFVTYNCNRFHLEAVFSVYNLKQLYIKKRLLALLNRFVFGDLLNPTPGIFQTGVGH